ncbi:MAG: hypothetical protein GXO22_04310, partial [Aquificae bacterium]|nr:hypothetical protein [Aquificota bacterium]
LNIIHKDLKDFIKKINDKSKISEKQLELAIWHLKNDRLLLGLITLQESIRSKYMEDEGISESEMFSYDKRNQYKFGVDFLLRKRKLYRRLGENLRDEDKFNCCNNELQKEENECIKYWCLLTNLRNAGSHNLGEGERQEQVKNILDENCKDEYKNFLNNLKYESFIRGLYRNIPQSIKNLL